MYSIAEFRKPNVAQNMYRISYISVVLVSARGGSALQVFPGIVGVALFLGSSPNGIKRSAPVL